MKINPLLNCDTYKYSHFLQYPPKTQYVYSYIESRGGQYPASLFFGLQAFIKEYLSVPVTKKDVKVAASRAKARNIPFNLDGFNRLVDFHKGFWPVKIRAVPEGSLIPVSNLLVDIINTDPEMPWVTSFLETALLRAIWYPTTVATREFYLKKTIKQFLEETADESALGLLNYKLNDFGARGASSAETTMLGGMAHLVCFNGTDNDLAINGLVDYYNLDEETELGQFLGVPAAEHSTMTSWNGKAGELRSMNNMLDQFAKPGAILACVSDSYDIWNAVDNYWGRELLDKVRNSGALVVVRPDSGDPAEVSSEVVARLGEKTGFTTNSKGFKVLPPYYRVIQGDGCDENSIPHILQTFKNNGLSTENIVFGMGGAMLQKLDRDTMKWAMKCSAIEVGGVLKEVYKDPITDKGKRSKRGKLNLIYNPDSKQYHTTNENRWMDNEVNVMENVYSNGKLLKDTSFSEIRERVEGNL